jgi:hypothetical protein
MSRLVLLVDPDVDKLGELASKLRARALEVAIADSVESAAERAHQLLVGVILVSDALFGTDAFEARIRSVRRLSAQPLFVLVDRADGSLPNQLERTDVDAIVRRVFALPSHSVPAAAAGDFRGDLAQVSVADLLQLLSMNRRSGTLAVTTPSGSGELRLTEGEVVDAVYRRVDGEKAVFRLLGETEGTFAFTTGAQQTLRRIERPSHGLLMEGMRQIDEMRSLRDSLSVVTESPGAPEVEQRVLDVLSTPHTLNELLDEIPALDLDILSSLNGLLRSRSVQRFETSSLRVELAEEEGLSVLSALARRLPRSGFEGPARLGVAASARRLAAMMSVLGRIVDVSVATDVPVAPVPHTLATLKLSDNVEVELVGIPLVEAYAPFWALVLPSCAAILRVEPEHSEALEAGCRLASIPIVEGEEILGNGGDADPRLFAGLLKVALERAAGD